MVFLLQLPWCVKEQLPLRLRFFCFALKNSFRCVWRSKSEVGFRRLWEFGEGQQFWSSSNYRWFLRVSFWISSQLVVAKRKRRESAWKAPGNVIINIYRCSFVIFVYCNPSGRNKLLSIILLFWLKFATYLVFSLKFKYFYSKFRFPFKIIYF